MKPYVIFSVIMFILLVGSLGTNIYTQNQLSQLRDDYAKKLDIEKGKSQAQKDAKNNIRDIWEAQAATNDKLVIAQTIVDDKTLAYQAQVKKSIRFINTVPQLLPGANEADMITAEKNLNDAQNSLEQIVKENTDAKTANKNKVDAIYLNLGEDQSNRANPREGTRTN